MTTVKQLREFLATLPDDVQVRILETRTRNYETFTEFVRLELPEKPAEVPFSDSVSFWGRDSKDPGFLDLGIG